MLGAGQCKNEVKVLVDMGITIGIILTTWCPARAIVINSVSQAS